MAKLTEAPVDKLAEAKANYDKFKTYAKKHNIGYARVYTSFNSRKKVVRTKVYAVSGVANHSAALTKMGFTLVRPTLGNYASLISEI